LWLGRCPGRSSVEPETRNHATAGFVFVEEDRLVEIAGASTASATTRARSAGSTASNRQVSSSSNAERLSVALGGAEGSPALRTPAKPTRRPATPHYRTLKAIKNEAGSRFRANPDAHDNRGYRSRPSFVSRPNRERDKTAWERRDMPSNCAACAWVSPSARRRRRKSDLMSACADSSARRKAFMRSPRCDRADRSVLRLKELA